MSKYLIFFLKFFLLFNLALSANYHFDTIDTIYNSDNSQMNHLLYNYVGTPYETFFLYNSANSSNDVIVENVNGVRWIPKTPVVIKIYGILNKNKNLHYKNIFKHFNIFRYILL